MGDQNTPDPDQAFVGASTTSLEPSASLKRHQNGTVHSDTVENSRAKRLKVDVGHGSISLNAVKSQDRIKGVVPIKPESVAFPAQYRVRHRTDPCPRFLVLQVGRSQRTVADDDAAEASGHTDGRESHPRKRSKQKGQNVARDFGSSRDTLQLCSTRVTSPEFSPEPCRFGAECKFGHDIREYLCEGKRRDLQTFG